MNILCRPRPTPQFVRFIPLPGGGVYPRPRESRVRSLRILGVLLMGLVLGAVATTAVYLASAGLCLVLAALAGR